MPEQNPGQALQGYEPSSFHPILEILKPGGIMLPEDIRNNSEDAVWRRVLLRAAQARQLGKDLRELAKAYVNRYLARWEEDPSLPSSDEQRRAVLTATLSALERRYQRSKKADPGLPADLVDFLALCAKKLVDNLPDNLNEEKQENIRAIVTQTLGIEAVFPYVYVVAGDYREAERLSLAPAQRLQEKIKELTYTLLIIFAEQRGDRLTEEQLKELVKDRKYTKNFFENRYRGILPNIRDKKGPL